MRGTRQCLLCLQRSGIVFGRRNISTDTQEVVARIATGVVEGNRFMLSKAITLAESTRADHRRLGAAILAMALQARADRSAAHKTKDSLRIGISGPPGVGKSTFIEALGMALIRDFDATVAVVAIDPTSQKSHGSILGDKTRMPELSINPKAYVRPCAAGFMNLGGLALHSDEVVLLCEAAGHDIILIETVGVGQSETLVTELADMCLLLLPPAGGDDLQGIKRGIVETAHLIVVNKADGDMVMAARRSASYYKSALQVMHRVTAHKEEDVSGGEPGRAHKEVSGGEARGREHKEGDVSGGEQGRETSTREAERLTAALGTQNASGQETQTPEWSPKVLLCSATTGAGIPEICAQLFEFAHRQRQGGHVTRVRALQRGAWMWRKAEDDVVKALRSHPAVRREAERLTEALGKSELSSRAAGAELVRAFLESVKL